MVTTTQNYRRNWRGPPKALGCGFIYCCFMVVSFVIHGWQTAQAFVTKSEYFVITHKSNPRLLFRRFCIHRQCDILCTPQAKLLAENSKEKIASCLSKAGLWDADSQQSSSEGLLLLASDFVDRPEVFSSLLIKDFGFPVLEAHQTRAIVMAAIRDRSSSTDNDRNGEKAINSSTFSKSDVGVSNDNSLKPSMVDPNNNKSKDNKNDIVDNDKDILPTDDGSSVVATTKPKTFNDEEFKATIVNERARRRKRSVDDYNYGLPKDYATRYPTVASELDDFYNFMTQPSTYSQESPIRDATAKVYMNHARLFLGWCVQNVKTEDGDSDDSATNDTDNNNHKTKNDSLSIFAVLPNKEKESANNIIRFVLWMRTRDISVSYEANLLRGLIKLLKFRFAKESNSDPLDGQNTFDDIPIIKEVRKLHRDANQRQRLAPRSSDESKKWITWQEYLSVTQNTKNEAMELIRKYEELPKSKRRYAKGDTERLYSLEQIRVADAYQRYLILAILASIPDRQRTIRELEVGRTLMKDTELGCWVVKHGPGDYKTGKHYGERPAMQLAAELTPSIDDFLERWRPALKPSTNVLLVQSKTGKPMTSNSIFKRVVRCCFKHTGKSVNPHLLRDIIVTHVRETDASEKELEALALYMGHSIQMQRTSYDRRTLSTKVAPAISLMKSVNKMEGG